MINGIRGIRWQENRKSWVLLPAARHRVSIGHHRANYAPLIRSQYSEAVTHILESKELRKGVWFIFVEVPRRSERLDLSNDRSICTALHCTALHSTGRRPSLVLSLSRGHQRTLGLCTWGIWSQKWSNTDVFWPSLLNCSSELAAECSVRLRLNLDKRDVKPFLPDNLNLLAPKSKHYFFVNDVMRYKKSFLAKSQMRK
jgi:hypothetical protein